VSGRRAVLMVGGMGRRLRPYTYIIPKPLIPIGDKPILEIIIRQIVSHGFDDITMACGYQADRIRAYFQDGSIFGCNIDYIVEEDGAWMGTAGSLRRINRLKGGAFLLMNGDLLTRLDYSNMYEFHRKQGTPLTIGLARHKQKMTFGVVETNGRADRIKCIHEKPVQEFLINSGIYILEPRAVEFLPPSGPCDMPDFIERIMAGGEEVASYPIDEYWLDVGNIDNLEKARKDFADWEDTWLKT
jgi:NDP-sugar pyrophosphorylase family protein